MISYDQVPVFEKILQQSNARSEAVLEAAMVSQVLLLRLTVSKCFNSSTVFLAKISNLDEYLRLKSYVNTIQQVLDVIKNPNMGKLDLDDMCLILRFPIGKKNELARIIFEQEEIQIAAAHTPVEDVIERCSSKASLDNDELKRMIQVLGHAILQLGTGSKIQERINKLREQLLGTFNEKKVKANEDIQNLLLKNQEAQMNLLQKEIIDIRCQINDMESSLMKMENDQKQKGKFKRAFNKSDLSKINKKISKQIGRLEKYMLRKIICVGREFESVRQEVIKVAQKERMVWSGNLTQFKSTILSQIENHKESIQQKFIEQKSQIMKFIDTKMKQELGQLKDSLEAQINFLSCQNKKYKGKLKRVQSFMRGSSESFSIEDLSQTQSIEPISYDIQQQKWFSDFTFDGKVLTKITEEDGVYRQFVIFKKITFEKVFEFCIKILVSKNRAIMIGVIDYDKQKDQKRSHNTKNAICYFAANGTKWPDQVKQGNGVDVGATLDVRVDRNEGTIKWMINGRVQALCKKQVLREKDREWFPFVQMFHKRDSIGFSVD